MHFSDKDESLPWRPPSAALGVLALLALHLLALRFPALAQQNVTEDQVKAAYLLNFAKLADWHHNPQPDGPAPLVIGVSGGDEDFLNVLKGVVAGKIIDNHMLVVRSASSEDDMKSCRIVFFRASGRRHMQAAMENLAQAGVLLVGEDESFLQQGGMINLVRDHGSIRFEVNPAALDLAEIHFSAKMLALAKAAYEPPSTAASNVQVGAPRRLERSVPPEYPAIAQRMKLSGTVQVQALVKPDGTVEEVKIIGGHPLLAAAVAEAVRRWKYQPAPKQTMEVVKFTFPPQ
jgi:TonB family protein